MANEKGPNVKKKAKCKNCEGKGLLKKGDKVVKCQRCKGTGVRRGHWPVALTDEVRRHRIVPSCPKEIRPINKRS